MTAENRRFGSVATKRSTDEVPFGPMINNMDCADDTTFPTEHNLKCFTAAGDRRPTAAAL